MECYNVEICNNLTASLNATIQFLNETCFNHTQPIGECNCSCNGLTFDNPSVCSGKTIYC
jgi:hypothetical protein